MTGTSVGLRVTNRRGSRSSPLSKTSLRTAQWRRILFNRRSHSVGSAACVPRPLAVVVDTNSLLERLRLADPRIEHAIDQLVIDLCHSTVELETEVMDDHVRLPGGELEVDLVCRVALPHHAGPSVPDLLFDAFARRRIDIRTSQERVQGIDLRLLVIGNLDYGHVAQIPGRAAAGRETRWYGGIIDSPRDQPRGARRMRSSSRRRRLLGRPSPRIALMPGAISRTTGGGLLSM